MAPSEAPPAFDRYALVALDLIDEPELPERETMEEAELAELAISIGDVGLIEPLIVKDKGPRVEVIAGHRRLLACRLVKLDPVPCIIMAAGNVDPLAILVAENAHRENVNPVEEARFYEKVLEGLCQNDVDLLCLKVRRNRGFVEDRLLLLRGYPTVVEALHQKKISIAVARELNKVKHPNQLMLLLDTSVRQGATARQVAEWRKEYDGKEDFQLAAADPNDQATNPAAIAPTFRMECLFCEDGDDPHLMEMFYLHKPCKKIVLKMLGRVAEQNVEQAG
jgi:ParB family chromosome partitioning protein